MNTDNLRREVQRWTAKLTELDQRAAREEASLERIRAERKEFVLSAIAEEDAGARKELRRLDGELAATQQSAVDLGTAREQLQAKLAALQTELSQVERAENLARLETLDDHWTAACERLQMIALREVLPLAREIQQLVEEMAVTHRALGIIVNERSLAEQYLQTPLIYPLWLFQREIRFFDRNLFGIGECLGATGFRWPGYQPSELTKDPARFLTTYAADVIQRRMAKVITLEAPAQTKPPDAA